MLLEIHQKQEDASTSIKRPIEHRWEPYSEGIQTLFKQPVEVDSSMSLKPTAKTKISPSHSGAIPKVYTCERCQQIFSERQRFQDHREKCED